VALGAEHASVIRLVVGEMETQLFGVKARDPMVFLVSIGAVFTASAAAAFLPARRAAAIDPIRALRHE